MTDSNSNSKLSSSSSSARTPKRLVFDRRYGWVFDEWKDPSEEALAGGRGMFCIVPLARAFTHTVSQTINLVASSTVEVLGRPELLSPQRLQSNLNDQLRNFVSSVKRPEINLFAPRTLQPDCCPSEPDKENSDSRTG